MKSPLQPVGFLVQDMWQPPWPLHSFCPLQAWVAVLQPPWPLQAFLPAQSCFCMEVPDSMPALPVEQPLEVSIVPLTSPARAAAATIDPVLAFIVFLVLQLKREIRAKVDFSPGRVIHMRASDLPASSEEVKPTPNLADWRYSWLAHDWRRTSAKSNPINVATDNQTNGFF